MVDQAEAAKSRFNGKKLQTAKKTGKQFFQELLNEIVVTLKDRPYSERHPIAGSSLIDCKGMETHRVSQMPPIEPLVVSHLHPSTSLSFLSAITQPVGTIAPMAMAVLSHQL